MVRLGLLAAGIGLLPLACGGRSNAGDGEGGGDHPAPGLETVASDLEVPWALGFAPDGRLFVTERPGRVRVVEHGRLRATPWATLEVRAAGEAGLMGLAVSPDFSISGFVYVVGTFGDGERLVNRVLRLTDRNGMGADPVTIVDGIPAAEFHAGDAVAFGPDGMLYVGTGDARDPESAQDMASLAGKILRYRPDGAIPSDNPVPASPVYALGLRNPQGLAWHPKTGELFAVDQGPSGFANERFRRNNDELNLIIAGANYGWPAAAGPSPDRRFVPPVTVWTPSIAPAGLAIYSGNEPGWYGDLFVGALRGEQLRRIVLTPEPEKRRGWRVARQGPLLREQLGRIRAVAMGPDGYLYFTTSNRDGRGVPRPGDDRVMRVVPQR